jgi:hypothetical protein
MARVWLEAESFENLGGWLVDQQSMDQMGSSYIHAHGMGVPVSDATTNCAIPEAGTWTVWVRTRNWTAAWGRGRPGGTFQVAINGQTLPETMGTGSVEWDWQKAGAVKLAAGSATIALHDLTGFNGRCDALYLTTEGDVPPNGSDELAAFRREAAGVVCEEDPTEYDLLVAGGGMSGICTAVAAARSGAKVVLIQDRSVLGGCNSSEIRVPLGGFVQVAPYPNLGRVVTEIAPIIGWPGVHPAEFYEDARKRNVFLTLPKGSCRLLLNTRVVELTMDSENPRRIVGCLARDTHTGAETRFRARLFADCTGDAILSRMAGAEVMTGRESRDTYGESLAPEQGDNEVMGMSVVWRSEQAGAPAPFPDIDWGLEINEENVYYVHSGDWEWEAGQRRNQAEETEYIRDFGWMTIYANWSYLKNHSARKDEWAHERLSFVTHLGGKRESYRVVGDHVLTQRDIEEAIEYPAPTGSTTWSLDLHFPDPEHLAKFKEPFRSCAYHRHLPRPYPVPYRCLYARDVDNLFLAGRHLSASHVAFSSVRVMRTLGMLGEVVGLAAALCAKEGILPRDVYESRFDALKEMMENGVPLAPTYHNGGLGSRHETYHLKEIGHLEVFPRRDERLNDPVIAARIAALGVQHSELE